MRHSCSGGCYGKPFRLQLIRPDGKEITLTDTGTSTDARRLHREIMSVPKGPLREQFIREAYNRLNDSLGPEDEE